MEKKLGAQLAPRRGRLLRWSEAELGGYGHRR